MAKTINTRLLIRRDTAANWSTSTFRFKKGEMAYDLDNKVLYVCTEDDQLFSSLAPVNKISSATAGNFVKVNAGGKIEGTDYNADSFEAKFTDGSATIASESSDIITLKGGVKQSSGAISNTGTDITLAKVAKTGAYSDLTGTPTLGTAAACNTGTSAGNVPVLDSNGKLVESVLPAIAVTDVFVADSEAAMLALDAQRGDICIRTDISKSFILTQSPATTLANWKELASPADAVTSVNGQTGTVVLGYSDVGAEAAFVDGSATIASVSSDVVTLKGGVKQSGGAISNTGSDITLAKVAKTGSYTDLSDKPTGSATIASISSDIVTIKAGIVETDGSVANTTGSDITLAKVAKTGSYTDLTNTPTVFTDSANGLAPAASSGNKAEAETTAGKYYLCDDGKYRQLPANAFLNTNYYHTSGTWSGLTYTATANGGAGALAFTIPTGTTAGTVAVGNHTHTSLDASVDVGGTTQPVYFVDGVPTVCSAYAGGTAVTLNGTSAAASTASFYAPTGSGTANAMLFSSGANSAPVWETDITFDGGTASA